MKKYFFILFTGLFFVTSKYGFAQYTYTYKTNAYLQKDKYSFTKEEIASGQIIKLNAPNAKIVSCQAYFMGDTLQNVHVFSMSDSLLTLKFFYSKLTHSPYRIVFDDFRFLDEKRQLNYANGFAIEVH